MHHAVTSPLLLAQVWPTLPVLREVVVIALEVLQLGLVFEVIGDPEPPRFEPLHPAPQELFEAHFAREQGIGQRSGRL